LTPRVVIAAAGSGAGKTTVTEGLIVALRARGLTTQGFKVGPDYIDPSYHTLASGRPGRNLDPFMSGPELIAPLFLHGAEGAQIAVIEGVMGLFDGLDGASELGSTAQVAKLLRAPVVLVIDASAMARSVAALVSGFRDFDPELNVAGVILNKVGSEGHAQMLREAIATLPDAPPVLGALLRDRQVGAPERHLGLVPVGERQAQAARGLAALGELVAASVDLELVVRIARAAPALPGQPWSPSATVAPAAGTGESAASRGMPVVDNAVPARSPIPERSPIPVRIALARGPAFSFHYQENLELLTAAGAELIDFDPTVDTELPQADGLILAGGFPETYAAELAANAPLRAAVARFAGDRDHHPVLAECGGLLYLGEQLDGQLMCGVLPLRAAMTRRLTIGYREAVVATATPWCDAGTRVRGHEFHYSQCAFDDGTRRPVAWSFTSGTDQRVDGIVQGSVHAGYLHLHWAAIPGFAYRFVAAAARTSAVAGAGR
jgi:cobyrinic acid a,c-diamide synthase